MNNILSNALISKNVRKSFASSTESKKNIYTKVETGKRYQHNYEKTFYEQKTSLETARELSDSAQKIEMLNDAEHKTSDMHAILTEVISFIGKETKNWVQLSNPVNRNSNDFQKKYAENILTQLQNSLNKKSSLDGRYLLSGEKIDTAPVDFSGNFDKDTYYKGSKTNVEFNIGENVYEFDLNAGNEKISDFVMIMKEIIDDTYVGEPHDVDEALADFFKSMNESRRLIDLQNRNYRDMKSAEEERYKQSATTYNNITNIDTDIALTEMIYENDRLNALFEAIRLLKSTSLLEYLK